MTVEAAAAAAGRPGARRAAPSVRGSAPAVLTVAALGVVFGDIDTSPLYALQRVVDRLNGGVVGPTPSRTCTASCRCSSGRSR